MPEPEGAAYATVLDEIRASAPELAERLDVAVGRYLAAAIDRRGGCPMPDDCDESGHLTVYAEDGEYVMPCPHHRPIALLKEHGL